MKEQLSPLNLFSHGNHADALSELLRHVIPEADAGLGK